MVAQLAERRHTIPLYGVQDDFIHDVSRFAAFVAGRNSGKTYAGSVKALTRALEPSLGVIAAPDFPMLEDGAKRQFIQRLDEAGLVYHLDKQRNKLFIPRTGCEVTFATLETESRARGPNYDWGWADEVEYVARVEVWRAFKAAVRAGDHPQLWVTTTPKGRHRIVYPEWVIGADRWHTLYHATTRDNVFIDADDYIAAMGYSGDFALQEIEAEFVAFDGLVYPGFDRLRAVRVVDVTGWRTVLGVDVGTRNPTAILTVHAPSDERRHVSRELYRRGMSSSEIVGAVVSEYQAVNADVAFLDPSAAGYIADLINAGINAQKANNDVLKGIATVTTALAEGLTVDPACVNLIAEFESYRYPENRRNDDKPLKESDHAEDALRYSLMGLHEAPVLIETTDFGDTQRNAWSAGFGDDVFHGWS